jgi:2'-5' RNA ligase
MRAFINFNLDLSTKEQIALFQQKLMQRGIKLRWSDPRQMHITLAFFEDIKGEEIEKVQEILKEEAMLRGKIVLQTGKLGGYPRKERAHILVLNVEGEVKKIKSLVKRLRRNLEREKINFDHKPFDPHITIGRTRTPLYIPTIKMPKMASTFEVEDLDFTKSEFTNGGSIYSLLYQVKLGKI